MTESIIVQFTGMTSGGNPIPNCVLLVEADWDTDKIERKLIEKVHAHLNTYPPDGH